MGYVLRPGRRAQQEVRRVAAERLDGAIALLDEAIRDPETTDLQTAVHAVRKRCKASRGLARLVRPALGDEFRRFDRRVRDAAGELSALRDAHVVLTTFDALLTAAPDDDVLRDARARQDAIGAHSGRAAVTTDDERLTNARALLVEARDASQRWRIPRGFDTFEAGIAATYRRGRSARRGLDVEPTDHQFHEWRKAAKYLWYEMQLVHRAAPSVLGPLVDELDRLAEMLGDEHDLTVLVELIDDHPDDFGSTSAVDHLRTIARTRQGELRERALRAGATIYAERPRAFGDRVARYWRLAVDLGTEFADEPGEPEPPRPPDETVRSTVERERKFLIDELPDDLVRTAVVELRQGYLAASERRSVRPEFEQAAVRVRDAGPEGCTLTVKAGHGPERTELEWPIARLEFEAAWPHTEGRRIEKTRHRIPVGSHVVELDVFGGDLDGLVVAEVEFDSTDAMDAFVAPSWFGREVTDDSRYANASLALDGLPTP